MIRKTQDLNFPDDALVTAALAAFIASASLIIVVPVLRRFFLDAPNHRSSHRTPVPRGAGIALLAGFTFASVPQAIHSTGILMITIAAVILGLIGLLDDRLNLPTVPRLVGQAVIASVLVMIILRPERLADVAAGCCAIIAVVGYTNAFNFMDGLNGISAFNAMVATAWFALCSYEKQDLRLATVLLALTAILVVFLPWNYPRALVFLGDAGSYSIGAILVLSALTLWKDGVALPAALAPLVVYFADTGITLAKRIVKRRSWNEPHREHVYQRMVDSGRMNPAYAAPLVAIFSFGECLAWHLLSDTSIPLALIVMLAILGAYLTLPQASRLIARAVLSEGA